MPAEQPRPASTTDAVWAYEKDLLRLARFLCGNRQDAEDVAHSSLVKAVEHLGGFRSEATLRTWLHRIATNECLMLRRRPPPAPLPAANAAAARTRMPDADEDVAERPDDALVEAEQRRLVLEAIDRLPQRERLVLLLAGGEGLAIAEVARRAAMTTPAARSLLYRARRRIRRAVAADRGPRASG